MSDVVPLQPGDPGRLGDHTLVGRLGEGRRGVVFQGEPLPGDGSQGVAVKLLHTRLSGDGAARAEFRRILLDVQRAEGSRFARLLGADVAGDWPYVVSELVTGPSLQEMITRTGRGDQTTVERLAIGLALGLASLHRAAIAHGELRPSNVLLAADGPKLIDVGVAHALAAAGVPVDPGLPTYLAPERLTGGQATASADVWSWAAIIATVCAGRPPFGDDTVPAITDRVLHGAPDLDRLPDSLREMVIMSLGKDPSLRPTAQALLTTLLRHDLPLSPAQLAEAHALLGSDPRTPTGSFAPLPSPLDNPLATHLDGGAFAAPTPGTGLEPSAEAFGPDPDLFRSPGPLGTAIDSGPYPAPEASADPFSGPYLPPAPAPGTGVENRTAVWERPAEEGRPPTPGRHASTGRTAGFQIALQAKLRDRRVIKGLAALTVGVLGGILVIAMLGGFGGGDDPKPQAEDSGAPPAADAFSGTWKGTATNQDGAKFKVEVTFSDAEKATAKISAGPCTAELTKTGGGGKSVEMALKITSGKCTPGKVTVTDKGGNLTYAWVNGTRHYEATLSR